MVDASDAAGSVIGFAKRLTPRSAQGAVAGIFDGCTNFLETIAGRRRGEGPIPSPPLRLRLHVGPFLDPRLFRFTAQRNLAAFRELAGLRPDSAFLDIGCGVGRMASALTAYLLPTAKYEGFDAARPPVDWCNKEITRRFPNFSFRTTDTFSVKYNPSGKSSAAQLVFPYEAGTFDFIFAGSVYTHMLPEEARNFVMETARVLKPSGVSFATFCLLNEASLPAVVEGKTSPILPHAFGEFRVKDPSDPASFIAQPESFVRGLFSKAGLAVHEPLRYGTWARAPETPEEEDKYCFAQDIVLATNAAV